MSLAAAVEHGSSDTPSCRDEVLLCPQPVRLRHGGVLGDLRIAFSLHGPAEAPVVLALGGISANRHVLDNGQGTGWWCALIGNGKTVDSQQVRVLSIDWIGGAGESSGSGQNVIQTISTEDQANAIVQVLDYLGIERLQVAIGASYGGMVVQQLAALYPERVGHLLILAAAHRPNPLGTAWRSIQRQIIRQGVESGQPDTALALARQLAMTTYRSAEEFAGRFAGPANWQGEVAQFPVEPYLNHCGQDFCRRFTPGAFLCLSESIDLHAIDPADIKTPTTLVGFSSDQLVPVADLENFKARVGAECRLWILDSQFGHDGFLKEVGQLIPIFRSVLEA